MINNGEIHYDNDKDGYFNEFPGCEAQFRSKKYDTFISVKYQNFTLTVGIHFDLDFKYSPY